MTQIITCMHADINIYLIGIYYKNNSTSKITIYIVVSKREEEEKKTKPKISLVLLIHTNGLWN